MRIYISPSDQTDNVGVGNYGTEAARMQDLANRLGTALANKNHTVLGCKNTISRKERIQESNNLNANFHIALHSNAGGGTGPEIFYYTSSSAGKGLAEKVLQNITAVPGCPPSRGVKASSGLEELNSTKAVAILIEVAFHDNEYDAQWIINNMNAIASAIAAAF